jgi:hypothetical protein
MVDNSRFRRNAAGGYVQRPVPPSRLVAPVVPAAPVPTPIAQPAPAPTGPAPRPAPVAQTGWQHPMARPGGINAPSFTSTPRQPQPQPQPQVQAQPVREPQQPLPVAPAPIKSYESAPQAPTPMQPATVLKPVWQNPPTLAAKPTTNTTPASQYPPTQRAATPPSPQAATSVPAAPKLASQPAPQNVSIEIKLPAFKLPNLEPATKAAKQAFAKACVAAKDAVSNIPRQYPRKVVVGAIVFAVLLAGTGAGLKTKDVLAERHAVAAAKAITDKAKLAATSPAFTPITPAKDTATATTSTKTQIAFDATRNVYSFSDSFKGNNLVVSQQPIPDKFKSGAEAVNSIAASLSAKQSTPVDGGVAYIASDAKSGSQTVVFTKNDLLIFIQSPFRHDASDWKTYIDTFKT